jgi:hypothetical protein
MPGTRIYMLPVNLYTCLGYRLTNITMMCSGAGSTGQTRLRGGGLWEVSAPPAPNVNAMATPSMPCAQGASMCVHR